MMHRLALICSDQVRACHRDIVEVTEEGHRHHGARFHVLSGMAGIGSRYIHACAEDNRAERIGLRHDQVAIVGRVPLAANLPMF